MGRESSSASPTRSDDEATLNERFDDSEAVSEASRDTSTDPAVSQPIKFGHYVVLRELGRGGMGITYVAYDIDLRREVAIKLVRPDAGDKEAQDRLLTEARAMARLAHPNVVPVYEVGRQDDHIFIVMEYVQGRNLSDWYDEAPRSPQDILQVFRQVGAGLSTAHQAGLVHRDFKPANAVLGTDGRVRVLDFGVVRVSRQNEVNTDALPPPSSALISDSNITLSGRFVGTPAYAAPEQILGDPVDARSDQFSFCVGLYRALYRQRPFEGKRLIDLLYEVSDGRLRPPPKDTPAPGWLWPVVSRGLASRPEDRWPSMQELLTALEEDETHDSARGTKMVLGSAVVLLAVAMFMLAVNFSTQGQCESGKDALRVAWRTARTATQNAFLATGKPHASDVFDRVDAVLSTYGAAWGSMFVEACEATRKLGTQSDALLDLRMACLERRERELNALVVAMSEDAAASLDHAVQAARQLVPISVCADVEALTAEVPRPEDPQQRKRVDTLDHQVERAEALLKAGRYAPGIQLAVKTASASVDLGFDPLLARSYSVLGALYEQDGRYADAERIFGRGLEAASRAKDVQRAVYLWNRLLWVVGIRRARFDEAVALERAVDLAILAAGNPDDARAELLATLSAVFDERDEFDRALQYGTDALALMERAHGPEHPAVAKVLNGLGILLARASRQKEAVAYFARALEIEERVLGKTHPNLTRYLNNLGISNTRIGNLPAALAAYERASAIYKNTLGPDHPYVAHALAGRAITHLAMKEHERALALSTQAVDIWDGVKDASPIALARTLSIVAEAQTHLNRPTVAYQAVLRAYEVLRKGLGEAHPITLKALDEVSQYDFRQGHVDRGLARLEEGLRIAERAQLDLRVAYLKFDLARALWAHRPHQRGRARSLAQEAKKTAPASNTALHQAMNAWMSDKLR